MLLNNAVFGWCYSKYDGWSYMFLYIVKTVCESVTSQIRSLVIHFYASGFVHGWRGRHWRR